MATERHDKGGSDGADKRRIQRSNAMVCSCGRGPCEWRETFACCDCLKEEEAVFRYNGAKEVGFISEEAWQLPSTTFSVEDTGVRRERRGLSRSRIGCLPSIRELEEEDIDEGISDSRDYSPGSDGRGDRGDGSWIFYDEQKQDYSLHGMDSAKEAEDDDDPGPTESCSRGSRRMEPGDSGMVSGESLPVPGTQEGTIVDSIGDWNGEDYFDFVPGEIGSKDLSLAVRGVERQLSRRPVRSDSDGRIWWEEMCVSSEAECNSGGETGTDEASWSSSSDEEEEFTGDDSIELQSGGGVLEVQRRRPGEISSHVRTLKESGRWGPYTHFRVGRGGRVFRRRIE